MKNAISYFRPMTMALVFVFTTVFSASTMANDEKAPVPGIEFKFIGNLDNNPVFLLNLTSDEKNEYIITISDESGYVLYSGTERGTNITKKFMLNTDEIGNNPLKVEIKSKSTNQVQVYEIGTTRKTVVQTVVNKIK